MTQARNPNAGFSEVPRAQRMLNGIGRHSDKRREPLLLRQGVDKCCTVVKIRPQPWWGRRCWMIGMRIMSFVLITSCDMRASGFER